MGWNTKEALSVCKKARTGVGEETRKTRVNGVTYMHNEEGTRKRTRVRCFVTEIVAKKKGQRNMKLYNARRRASV